MRRGFAAVATLAAGALGGIVFDILGLPASWISGALVSTLVLAVAGAPIVVPEFVRFVAFVILGTSMGTALTPDMLSRAANWPISMACLALSVSATMLGGVLFLTRVAKWDLASAFYASAPGAFSTVIAMAGETAADMRKVAFAQALRLFLLVAALPNVLNALGSTGQSPPHALPMADPSSLAAVGLLLLVGCAVGLLAERVRIPGGLIIGALAGSAAMHLTDLSEAQLPAYLLVPAFVVLGASVGTRFVGTTLATIRSFMAVSLGAFLVALSLSACFAALAAALTDDDFGKILTAFAPGALETMSALGFAMGFDPAFMSAHHLFRFASLSVALPVAARLLFGTGTRT